MNDKNSRSGTKTGRLKWHQDRLKWHQGTLREEGCHMNDGTTLPICSPV